MLVGYGRTSTVTQEAGLDAAHLGYFLTALFSMRASYGGDMVV